MTDFHSTRTRSSQLYVPQMEELKRTELADLTRLNWQVAQNLMGYADDPTVLIGDAANEQVIIDRSMATKKSMIPVTVSALKSYLWAYLGEYELGAKQAIRRGDAYLKTVPGASFGMWDVFTRGIALYAMARKTGKRKFKKHAEQTRKTIQSWSEKGNPNVHHHLLLLDAENAALGGNVEEARTLYGKAISTAARGGFIPDAALGNERYADFVCGVDQDEAKFRMGEALRFYSEWGASFKVTKLCESHPEMLDLHPPDLNGFSALSFMS